MNSLGGGGGFGGQRGPTGQIGNKTPSGTRVGQIAQYTPEQMELLGRSYQQAGPDSYLSKLAAGDQDTFNQAEAPALRQFSGLQGNIASKYSAPGMGARKSSGFQNDMGQKASDFAMQLQSNRQNLQRQAMLDLRGLTGELLNYRPYETFGYEKPKKQGFDWGGALGGLGGAAAGFFTGGPAGAVTGASMGYNAFGRVGGGGGSSGFQGSKGWQQPSWLGGQGGNFGGFGGGGNNMSNLASQSAQIAAY